MVVLVIIGYSLLVIYEFIPLYKEKQWAEFWTNAVLGCFSFAIAVLLSLGIRIPSPAVPLQELVTFVFGK